MLHVREAAGPDWENAGAEGGGSGSASSSSCLIGAPPAVVASLTPPWTYARLKQRIAQARAKASTSTTVVPPPPQHLSPRFQYRDTDGDLITVSSEKELSEMLRHLEADAEGTKPEHTDVDQTEEADCVLLTQTKPITSITLTLVPEEPSLIGTASPSGGMVFREAGAVMAAIEEHSQQERLLWQVKESPEEEAAATTEIDSPVGQADSIEASLCHTSESSLLEDGSFVWLASTPEHKKLDSPMAAMAAEERESPSCAVTEAELDVAVQLAAFVTLLTEAGHTTSYKIRRGVSSVVRAGCAEYRRNPVWFALQTWCLFVMMLALLASSLHGPSPPQPSSSSASVASIKSLELATVMDAMSHTLAEAEDFHAMHAHQQQLAIDQLQHEIAMLKAYTAKREAEERRWRENQTVRAWMTGAKEQALGELQTQATRLRALAKDVAIKVEAVGHSIQRGSSALEDRLHEQLGQASAGLTQAVQSLQLPRVSVPTMMSREWAEDTKESVEAMWHTVTDETANVLNEAYARAAAFVKKAPRTWSESMRSAVDAVSESFADMSDRLTGNTRPRASTPKRFNAFASEDVYEERW